ARGSRSSVGGMSPFIVRPMQHKRRVRLYAESHAGRDLWYLAIEFPYFNRATFSLLAHVTIIGWVYQFAIFPVRNRPAQFDVFCVSPQQRHRRVGLFSENKMPGREVRCVPDLLGYEANSTGKILDSTYVRLRIVTGGKLVLTSFTGQQRP